MQTDLSEWAKDMKTLVFHVNAHPKVTSAEEFSNQVYQDDPNLKAVSLFPKTSLSLPNGPMNKVAMVSEMRVMHGCNT